ncbi:type III effector [Pseudovibrio sp. SCP19]|uniref:type III effector n=1 Tax=Pseudovibrio sp. SCP19 TaxID=3141374 RepID=UPI00333A1865
MTITDTTSTAPVITPASIPSQAETTGTQASSSTNPTLQAHQQKTVETQSVVKDQLATTQGNSGADKALYDLICVGRGTSAAAYLTSLKRCDCSIVADSANQQNVLVVGKDDPWAGARGYEKGHYTQCINQAQQLVNPGDDPIASSCLDPVDRKAWSELNAQRINQVSGGNILDAEVRQISRDSETGLYKVKTDANSEPLLAKKVVLATGAGIERSDYEYHHVPQEVSDFRKSGHPNAANCLDLDQFQRFEAGTRDLTGKVVAVMGPNAGTDAIMELATRGVDKENIFWMMKPSQKPGVALTWDVRSVGIDSTFTAPEAGKDRSDGGTVFRYQNINSVSAGENRPLTISTDGGNFEADFLVYAVGQRGGGTSRAEVVDGAAKQVPILEKELASQLQPVYDVNQRFSDLSSGGAWQHVVGLEVAGTTKTEGLEVVGAAAMQSSRGVQHNYLDADLTEQLSNTLESTPQFRELATQHFPALLDNKPFEQLLKPNSGLQQPGDYDSQKAALLSALKANDANQSLSDVNELLHTFDLRTKAANDLTAGAKPVRVSELLAQGLSRTQPATVADPRLIGGAQLNIAAQTESFKPQQITTPGGINFNEDQQTIALYVAQNYPDIPADKANDFVAQVIAQRTDGNHLRGFTPEERADFEAQLQALSA